MLALTRKKEESIMIGDKIEIKILEIQGDKVKIGIEAPKNVTIYRKEIFLEIQEENKIAAQINVDHFDSIKDMMKNKSKNIIFFSKSYKVCFVIRRYMK